MTEITLTSPEYFNENFQIKLPKIWRLSQRSFRYYFTADGQTADGVTFFPSVTTIISNTSPTPYGLKKLMMDMGADYYDFMNKKAKYGTLLHILISNYFKSGNEFAKRYIDFDEVDSDIIEYIINNRIQFDTSDWNWNIKKDLLSFLEFVKTHNIEPIATEIIGTYNNGDIRFAGAIDLICYMNIEEKGYFGEVYKSGDNKGLPKETKQSRRVLAIVDFKSGKNGFFDEYAVQLGMYKMIAEQSFNLKIDKLFNVAPKDWQNAPTFQIKEQADDNKSIIEYYSKIFFNDWEEPKEIELITGKTHGYDINIVPSYLRLSAKEFVFNKINNV